MALNTREAIWVEQCVTNEKKSVGATYLLWFFFWWLSAHRFYLGRPVSAILQIISYFFVIGLLWAFIDLLLIPGMVEDHKHKVRRELVDQVNHQKYVRRRGYDRYEDIDGYADRYFGSRYAS